MDAGPSRSADLVLTRLSAREQARLVAEGEVGPLELLEAHLGVIGRLNARTNAIVTLAEDSAREAAQSLGLRLASGGTLGPLGGLPIVVKDITPTAGIRTTYASPLYRDHIPMEDAVVVRRLKQAGAIVLGKTNTPEFAAGAHTFNALFGVSRNPWNTDLSPGGSSGGSAIAVATGMAPLAHGTDFGGSVRVPAAFCGICGIRPTPGLTPNHPMALPWDPGQVAGPLARNTEDVAFMLDAMVGYDSISPISVAPPWGSALDEMRRLRDSAKLRVAYAPDIARIGSDPEIAGICKRAAESLADSDTTVSEVAFDVSDGRDAYMTWRGFWMVGQQLERLEVLDRFGPNLAANVRAGLGLTAVDLGHAEHKRAEIFHRYRALFEQYDALLTPVVTVPPFPVEQNHPAMVAGRPLASYVDWIAPTFLVTLVGLPAVSVPAGLTQAGLPVGLQVIAPRFGEPVALAVAGRVERQVSVGWPPIASRGS